MAHKILRTLYVDYKVKGRPHYHRVLGMVDFALADLDEEDVACTREFLAETWRCKLEEITDLVFHF